MSRYLQGDFFLFFIQDALSSDEMRHAKMKMRYLNMKIIHILLFTSCHSKSQHLCVCVCVCVCVTLV